MEEYTNLIENGGVKKKIRTEGQGEPIGENKNEVLVNYECKVNNFVVDSNKKEPFRFTVGNNEVIRGWEIAVKSMKKGEKSSFIIKPDYAYRDEDHGDIPKNSTLTFEIELVDILPPLKSVYDMDYPEKYQRAKTAKEEGVEKFKMKDFIWAIEKFKRGLFFLKGLDYEKEE